MWKNVELWYNKTRGDIMKFTKHQKEILKQILAGNVYDICSYVKHFRLGEFVKYDSEKMHREFEKDSVPKRLYHAKALKKNLSNMLTSSQFDAKLEKRELNPDEYIENTVTLKFDAGIQCIEYEGISYSFDFYNGVFVAKSCADIREFLVLWQYLKSEMLILEVPQKCTKETLGLLFEKTQNKVAQLSSDNQIAHINLDDFTYSDRYYLGNETYKLSDDLCVMYGEYLNKKIYASTALDLFIKKRFRTAEERTQNSALLAAWLAIFVSILLTFGPLVHQSQDDAALIQKIDGVAQEIVGIRDLFEKYLETNEASNNTQVLIDKLDAIIDSLSNDKIAEETPPQETQQITQND